MSDTCNQYRTYKDMYDSWESLHDLVEYYGDNGRQYFNYTKPGSWNDPDQVTCNKNILTPILKSPEMNLKVKITFGVNDNERIRERALLLRQVALFTPRSVGFQVWRWE